MLDRILFSLVARAATSPATGHCKGKIVISRKITIHLLSIYLFIYSTLLFSVGEQSWHCVTGQVNCTALQCSPLGRNFMECSIIKPAPSLLMKQLVIGQLQKAPNFSAFHWSPHSSLVSVAQHFVTTRVVHILKWTKTSLITEADLITESNQAVRAVHSCNSWFRG